VYILYIYIYIYIYIYRGCLIKKSHLTRYLLILSRNVSDESRISREIYFYILFSFKWKHQKDMKVTSTFLSRIIWFFHIIKRSLETVLYFHLKYFLCILILLPSRLVCVDSSHENKDNEYLKKRENFITTRTRYIKTRDNSKNHGISRNGFQSKLFNYSLHVYCVF